MSDIDTVFHNWAVLRSQIQNEKTRKALTEISMSVQNWSLLRAPVDTGNLANFNDPQAEIYFDVTKGMNGFRLVLTYGAKYAYAVHEASGALRGTNTPRTREGSSGDYWDGYGGDQGEPKFLEKGVADMEQNDFDRIIRENYGT